MTDDLSHPLGHPLGYDLTYENVAAATASVRDRYQQEIRVGMMLGTGLGELPDDFETHVVIPGDTISGYPKASAPGHLGQLAFGRWQGVPMAVAQGRLHQYEGWRAQEVAMPVYLLKALGANTLVVTNAAGALTEAYRPGEVMLIEDHINLTGTSPIVGANDVRLGPRFPDMSDAYSHRYRDLATTAAESAGLTLHQGIYAGVMGPAMETSAERRHLRIVGGDVVGMSTVHEVIAASHCGMGVLGFSAITNMATGGPNQQSHTLDDILGNASTAGAAIWKLLALVIGDL